MELFHLHDHVMCLSFNYNLLDSSCFHYLDPLEIHFNLIFILDPLEIQFNLIFIFTVIWTKLIVRVSKFCNIHSVLKLLSPKHN